MPSREHINKEIIAQKSSAQDLVRRKYLHSLFEYTNRDTILYASAFSSKKLPTASSYTMSVTQEDIQGFMSALTGLKGDTLDLILHSPGGSLEAADQIVQYLRSKYNHIRAIIPQNAMSAATMLACACDEIVMGKQSSIGPIDPQITFPTQHGHFTSPAQAILDDFNKAKEEIKQDPTTAPLWVSKIQGLPMGFLTICDNTIKLAESKVASWLDSYMFKDSEKKGSEIAHWLADHSEHKTHGRPIGQKLAQEAGLSITILEDDQELQDRLLSVYHATMITLEVTNCVKLIENQEGRGSFLLLEPEKK